MFVCWLHLRRYALVSQEDGQQVVDAEELMEHTLNKPSLLLCLPQVCVGEPGGWPAGG
jgi:hypothetical protein